MTTNHSDADGPGRRNFTSFLGVCFLAIIAMSCGQQNEIPKPQASLFDQWQKDELLELNIETDLNALFANEEADQNATLTWGTQQMDAKLSVRGKTRKEICDFPPLKIKMDKEELIAHGFNPAFRSLKLVTHCLEGNEELVLREYLVYKMLNKITDKSFEVQLAKVTYHSPEGSMDTYAFLIEDKDEMGARVGGNVLEEELAQLKTIDAEQYRMLTVFQYMIGNTDWNLAKSHNIKLVQTDAKSAPIPVPYDFDHAGLVNAPYANPHPQLPIKNVRERFFQWRGANQNGLSETLAQFRAKQNDIYKLVLEFDYLSEASKQDILQYLDEFYHSLPQIPALAVNNKKVKAFGV